MIGGSLKNSCDIYQTQIDSLLSECNDSDLRIIETVKSLTDSLRKNKNQAVYDKYIV